MIKKIKLINKGIQGMNISHTGTVNKDGYDYILNNDGTKPRWPIHVGLREAIQELREYALELSGYFKSNGDKGVRDYMAQEIQVNEVIFGEEFQIIFIMPGFGGKSSTIKSQVVGPKDAYANYEEVQEILSRIQEETEHYLSGKVAMSSKQLAMELSDDDVTVQESVSGMNDVELDEFCLERLRKKGMVVYNPEPEEEIHEEEEEEAA